MKKYPWFKMWPTVWLSDPHLKLCKWDAKGLLADLMCIAHHGTPRGSVTNGGLALSVQDIAKTCSESVRKTTRLMQLLLKLNRIGKSFDGIWFIPSMIRETEQSEQASKDGSKGGNPLLMNTLNLPLNPTHKPDVDVEADKDVDVERGHNPKKASGLKKPTTSGRGKRARHQADRQTTEQKRQQLIQDMHDHEKEKHRKASSSSVDDDPIEAALGSAATHGTAAVLVDGPESLGSVIHRRTMMDNLEDGDCVSGQEESLTLAHPPDTTEPTKEKAPETVEIPEADQVGGDLV